ncbi:MAG: DUF4367 domain-containing protein [Lachnospiraceae bacterium]|nr:DUF4367 domain-containing protein [Lachnospiraceae bacterium]
MNLENMREEFPEMPESMRTMIEQEVASQMSVETPPRVSSAAGRTVHAENAARLDGAVETPPRKAEQPQKNRSTGRKKAGKTFLLVAAAAAIMCTTVAAGTAIRARFFTEAEGDYGVNITIGSAETETDSEGSMAALLAGLEVPEEIPASVTVEASYLPEGMVQYDDGWKIDYEDDIWGGSFSITEEIMGENPAETQISETNVVDSEELELNGHYAVWLEKEYLDDGSENTTQMLYILYPEVWRILRIYSMNGKVTKDELLAVAEGLIVTGSEETMLLADALPEEDDLPEIDDDPEEDGACTAVEAAAVEENLHQIGDSFEISAYSDSEADEENFHTVSVRVSEAWVSDNMSALGDDWQSILDSGIYTNDLQTYSDEDGNLLPMQIDYVKEGDGVNSLNTVVKTEEAEQKLICATIEYTNNGDAALHNVLYNADLITLTEGDDGMISIYDRSTLEEGDWDYATISRGYAMDYYTAGGEETNGSNYITDLLAGETVTVTVAWLVRVDEMPYLYLNMEGGSYLIYAEDLATGYVDFRSLEN